MPEAKRIKPYASGADFRRIFDREIDGLYLLSFLLTSDRKKAERCFVSGLKDSAPAAAPLFGEME